MASRTKERATPDQLVWGTLLDMMGETIRTQDFSFFCPPDTACRGGDAGGDYCKACWLKAVLKRLSEGRQ